MTQQEREIKTIKDRTITVKLSDADCDRITKYCGMHGIKVGELIASFICDLVDGTYSNGSDERDYANQYFERCWFSHSDNTNLVSHLLNNGYDPEEYLDCFDDLNTFEEERIYFEAHPDEADQEALESLNDDIVYYEDRLLEMLEGFELTVNHEQLFLLKKYVDEKHLLKGGVNIG